MGSSSNREKPAGYKSEAHPPLRARMLENRLRGTQAARALWALTRVAEHGPTSQPSRHSHAKASFGSFIVRSKCGRVGRNPKTGVEVPIDPRRVMVFKPSNVLKAHINGESYEGED